MSEDQSAYKHSASDRKLDKEASEASDKSAAPAAHAGHDPEKIAMHNDAGKDRLFEGRIQRDDADKESDRNRLEKDAARHHHADDEVGTISDHDQHKKK